MSNHDFRDRLKKAGRQTGKCLRKAAWQTCKCILWTACSPCICCAIIFMPGQRCRRCRAVPDPRPKPMVPSPRRRALTIPSTDWQEDQSTLEQPQSPFMTKLPLEIRRMIYVHALGEARIHLMLWDGELKSRRCRLAECAYTPCSPIFGTAEQKLDFALPMLTTCRLIYSEAIEFLYKSNSFFISTKSEDYPTAGYLSYFFLPQRMNQITKLHLDWDLDHGQHFHPNLMPGGLKDEWFNAWDALKKLTGLNQLYIRLFFRYDLWNQCYGFFWERNSEQLLEPVKAITTPRDFTIKLPNWRCPTDIDVGDSHCVFEVPARVDGDDVDDSLW